MASASPIWSSRESPDPDIGLIAGDIIYNLRASFDYLIGSLVPSGERGKVLCRHCGTAYEITMERGMFRAVRRDDRSAVTAPTAGHLASEIRADYQARPVPREG